MPFVEVKSIRGVFSGEEKARVIEEITDVFARMKGDDFAGLAVRPEVGRAKGNGSCQTALAGDRGVSWGEI